MEYQNSTAAYGRAHYINPGNALFDSLVDVVSDQFHDEMLKGTVLVSPEDQQPYFAFFVKNQIHDNRVNQDGEPNVANELLSLICQQGDGFHQTSPAKLLDLCPPTAFAKQITPPDVVNEDDVVSWAYEHITESLLQQTQQTVDEDTARRREYLQSSFQQIILDIQGEINELQGKVFMSDDEKAQQKLVAKEVRLEELKQRKQERLQELEEGKELFPIAPEVLGCAYVVPLNQVEYHHAYGMSRDDEVEAIAMLTAISYEQANGRTTEDVSKDNVGYDLKSIDAQGQKRYIEVKGRAATDGVMLSENEMNRLAQLGTKAWLYIVTNCKTNPQLNIINDPAHRMTFEQKTKGIQFYLPLEEWQHKTNEL